MSIDTHSVISVSTDYIILIYGYQQYLLQKEILNFIHNLSTYLNITDIAIAGAALGGIAAAQALQIVIFVQAGEAATFRVAIVAEQSIAIGVQGMRT